MAVAESGNVTASFDALSYAGTLTITGGGQRPVILGPSARDDRQGA